MKPQYLRVARFLAAAGLIGLILWKLPILEIAFHFLSFVVIPLGFLVAFGVVTKDTANIIFDGAGRFREGVERTWANLDKENYPEDAVEVDAA